MKAKLEKLLRADRPYMLYGAFISAVIFFSVASPVFLSSSNFVNIGRQPAIVTMLAVGMTFVVICAEIDLSIGSVLALSGMAAGLGMKYLEDVWAIGAICGIATGTLVGLINGVLTSRLRIPSFLVTLGMLGIARGIALMVTSTLPVVVINQSFIRLFGEGTLFGVPAPIAWTLVVIIVGYVILHKTVLGSLIYATGGNVVAAKYSGINTNAVKLLSFVSLGFLAGLAGLIFTARSHAARPDIGAGLELNVIAAVILGGTSLFGGRGTVLGTLLGCVIVGILDNGLILLGVTSSTQLVVKGVIIIAAVAFSRK